MHLIEWSNLSKQKNNLINQILLGKNIIGPFALMALLDSPKIIKKATEILANPSKYAGYLTKK